MGERCFWYQPGIYSVQPVCWLELGPILVHVSVPIGLQREALATALTLLLVIEAQLTWIQNFNNTFFQCSFEILSTLFIANVIHNSLPPLCYGWNQACRIAIFTSAKPSFFFIALHAQLKKVNYNPTVHLPNCVILSPDSSSRNLYVNFDNNISISQHISSVSKSCFHRIRDLRHICNIISHSTVCIIATTLIHSELSWVL